MHQFCFNCLLEWSKVKAVCPLCKQPFTSIIHNVKSNNEYDEHFITNDERAPNADDLLENFLTLDRNVDRHGFYLPSPFPTPPRHFQFRTTFTVDPRGELAIQQLLSTHPLTNVCGYHNQNYYRQRRSHRDVSTSNYRRSIYEDNMWVQALPDVTGRFRDISPQFFSENPAARNQLVPWLNRELNALLNENTQHVMYVVDVILTQMTRHHIRSRFFKNLLHEYLGNRTEHFIHEFYNFMRSPFDMIGYDRYAYYQTSRPDVSVVYIDDDEDSSDDVVFVSIPDRSESVVIEIPSDSSRDSDVIIREPTPPVVVDLINTSASDAPTTKPVLPLKIRLKHKRQCREKRNKKAQDYTSTDSSTSTTSSSDSEFNSARRRKYSQKIYRPPFGSTEDSSDDEPILSRLKKVNEQRKRDIKNNEGEFLRKLETMYPPSTDHNMQNGFKLEVCDYEPTYNSSMVFPNSHKQEHGDINQPSVSGYQTAMASYDGNNLPPVDYSGVVHKKEEMCDINQPSVSGENKVIGTIASAYENPGPSGSKPVVGIECKSWYSRPSVYSSDYSSD